jgi:hypothetical protein
MSSKYHVNPATGVVAVCHAQTRACIYGGDENHGESREAAQAKYEETMASKTTPSKLSKTPRTRKKTGFTPSANPEQAEANRLRARSSAAGTHDNRPNRERTRKDSKRAALRDQG